MPRAAGVAPLGPAGLRGCVLTLAWLGVLPNIPIAHDLIHRRDRFHRFLGFLCTIAIGDPLRRLAHLRGHHVKLGRGDDSDTARRGESLYAFIVRAAVGGTREGYLTEKSRLARLGVSVWSWQRRAGRHGATRRPCPRRRAVLDAPLTRCGDPPFVR